MLSSLVELRLSRLHVFTMLIGMLSSAYDEIVVVVVVVVGVVELVEGRSLLCDMNEGGGT